MQFCKILLGHEGINHLYSILDHEDFRYKESVEPSTLIQRLGHEKSQGIVHVR